MNTSSKSNNSIYVIGSGPAGVSCAHALVKMGLEVTMLDSGIELESERKATLEKLSSTEPENWDENSLRTIKENLSAKTSGTFAKPVYGSYFPYKETDLYFPYKAKNVQPRLSLAKGGLSNVWGAAILPFIDNDIKDWPISVKDLAPHYKSIFSFMDLAAVNDDLATMFPLYTEKYEPLNPSCQASSFMNDLLINKSTLKSKGFTFGHSRLAVRSKSIDHKPGCVYCGLCLFGCPYELIYNAAYTLNELKQNENFRYIKDVIVQKVSETNGNVTITAISRLNNEKINFTGLRVYLACGTIPTTKIILESLEAYDKELIIKDSQWFLIPMLRYKKSNNVTDENLYTLSQLFVEMSDSNLSKNTINLQVYTYNDLFLNAMKGLTFNLANNLLKYPVNELLGRLLLYMGYLHSDNSSTISAKLQRNNGKRNLLLLEANVNKEVNKIISGVYKKLFDNRDLFKAIPIPGITKIPKPGYGSHSGGSFPMRVKPKDFETDTLGRPTGFSKVHLVDSTIFPSIPATTITLTIMANAYRIGSAYNET